MHLLRPLWLLLVLAPAIARAELEFDVSGELSLQARFFSEEHPGNQANSNFSASIEPEFYLAWQNRKHSVIFTPYYREDENDPERSHGDIREAYYQYVGETLEWRAGLQKVFWGVTEFQHLVDIINQTDQVDDIDGEDKLGQPMIHLSRVMDAGILDIYLLTGFRERTFPSPAGRPGYPLPVLDQATYESDRADDHIDIALRWSQSIGVFDLGLSAFRGTSREPVMLPANTEEGLPALMAYYPQIGQLGLDAQATIDAWLWKLELVRRFDIHGQDHYWASQVGFEYTLYGLFDGMADLGLLTEIGWDQRREAASSVFQRDIAIGARLGFNDVASSQLLAGVAYDLDYNSISLLMEGSRRLGNNMTISVDIRLFDADNSNDPVAFFDRDDHIQLGLNYYF